MRRFSALYEELDRTTSTNAKVAALAAYFRAAPPADAAWALWFLSGRRLKRLLPSRALHAWTLERTGLPEWLLEDSYAADGDWAKTVALLLELPEAAAEELPLHHWVEQRIVPLSGRPEEEQRRAVADWWSTLPRAQVFLLNKLLTGAFRVGVSQTLVVRALAQAAGLEPLEVTQRLMGDWQPTADFFQALMAPAGAGAQPSRPYPFFLASPIEQAPESLGEPQDWLAEWKWDGIRAQIVRRAGSFWIWSRGEEPIAERFPELTARAADIADGTVLDGEIMAWKDGAPLPFAVLQQRIGRLKLTPKVLADAPAAFVAYDLLEQDGADLRAHPLRERRERLQRLVDALGPPFHLSAAVPFAHWDELAAARGVARERRVEGLMLKRWDSPYGSGRRRGDWWKWKVDPLSIDAVLIYAQAGSGRRANRYTDYTFAVWQEGELVPIAKAYSGLSDAEIERLDRWIRAHTRERFGPVRSLEPQHVFELHFEGIAESPRHRSGIALRFPRIARWREDKRPQDADTLERVRDLLRAVRQVPGP